MSWPGDDAKLDRVRSLMRDRGLDALVVRAPDNVLYLTNFWGMKGYDAVVFPVEGDPALICLEPSRGRAEHMAWTTELRFFAGTTTRSAATVAAGARDRSGACGAVRVGRDRALPRDAGDGPHGGRADDVPESLVRRVPACAGRDAAPQRGPDAEDPQEVERMRLANDIAAAAMEHVRGCSGPG